MHATRRSLLKRIGAAAALGVVPTSLLAPRARAQAADTKLLFVIAAAGGGSIIDSMLPILDPGSSPIVSYPASALATSGNFRCVHTAQPIELGGFRVTGQIKPFLDRHGRDVAVITQECTSVNHVVAQKRSLTGAGINVGRTILEAAAVRHGAGLVLPHVNMCESGYLEPGDDVDLPDTARAVAVADALLFPFATDGMRGIKNAPARSVLERARRARQQLDDVSISGQTFKDAPIRKRWIDARERLAPQMEAADLITKLTMVANVPGQIPLSDFDLESSPDGPAVREQFPSLLSDPLEAQAALAFLLARHRVSCSVAISPSFTPLLDGGLKNTPLAFDFSHNNHVLTQYAMWSRILKVTDGLITLLKNQLWDDNDEAQGTMWDRSLVYIASDFGRDKVRPPNSFEFGTGHHLNNGNVLISPLLNGGRVYGDVDAATGLTFGFDRSTGLAVPGTQMHEGDVYSVIAQALDIDFAGRLDIPVMVRA